MKQENKLPKEFKKQWINALESGEYNKGREQLWNKVDNTFCCLGVAGKICGVTGFGHNEYTYLTTDDQPNLRGLSKVPQILLGTGKIPEDLAIINDRTEDFGEVIDYIKKNL